MMSGRAPGSARLAAALLATVALAVPASSSGAPQHASAVTVSNFKLSATWKEGWLTASLHFTLAGATSINVSVRPVTPGSPLAHKVYAVTGSAAETIKLPVRPRPGDYVMNVSGAAPTRFTIPTPAEGISDSATISATVGGKSTRTIANAHELWVRFHFLVPPPGAKTVKIEWRTPSFTFVGAVTKPYSTTIDSDLKSNAALPKGTWYAILMVGSKIAKRQDVRVT
jgi:hypothetical protein